MESEIMLVTVLAKVTATESEMAWGTASETASGMVLEKKKRLEEAEAKRQAMLEAQKAGKADAGAKKAGGAGGADKMREMTKTKEQLEEEKKIALSIRIKPLDLEAMDSDDMKS